MKICGMVEWSSCGEETESVAMLDMTEMRGGSEAA